MSDIITKAIRLGYEIGKEKAIQRYEMKIKLLGGPRSLDHAIEIAALKTALKYLKGEI